MSRASSHIDRRALIRSGTTAAEALAAGATVTLGAIALTRAAGPDPIFAAIEARKETCARCDAAHTDEDVDEASNEDEEALRAMLQTVPSTEAGALALLRYTVDCLRRGDDVVNVIIDV